jgi:WD40 repeat protein
VCCCCRGVCVLPGVGFVSGSHDCSLRVWSLSGEVMAELCGHSAIIYSVAATPAGLIASGEGPGGGRGGGGDCQGRFAWRRPACSMSV